MSRGRGSMRLIQKNTAILNVNIPNRSLAQTLLENWSEQAGISLSIVRGRLTPEEARYELEIRGTAAKEVIVTGDFTKWATDQVRLARAEDGKWRAVIALTPGDHQYRLRVDGQWMDHPAAPKRVPNVFGTENCVVTVS